MAFINKYRSKGLSYLIVVLSLSLTFSYVNSLSMIMHTLQSYCFNVPVRKNQDIKVDYMISGLNEENVEFFVNILF